MNLRSTFVFSAAVVLASAAAAQSAPPGWTHGAVCYEVFVRSFFDSDGNGIGDLNGLTRKLDYINDGNPKSKTDLGARCIWLMPINPSPSYHGYDVTDYYGINPDYGTAADFKRFVAAAHERGIKVFMDMVLNHSSNEHPHFQAALHDTASPYRSWYRFSKTPGPKGPWGEDSWHKSPVRDEYYYGIFSAQMPDLNYDTPAVREDDEKIAAYWLKTMGVDGFRLDAVQYLAEQGACNKDCAGTHRFLRTYQAFIDSVKPGAYAIGEVWDPIDTLLTYYPHQLTAYFTFELSAQLRDAIQHGASDHMFDEYLRMQDTLPSYRWSTLLDNHDMTRIATVLHDSVAVEKEAATLLLTLPGLPYVYYGDEIGMVGDKPDPRLRTPMQWAPVPGMGFTTGQAWERAQADSMTRTVAQQTNDPNSLLNLYRRLIHLRGTNDALATGRLVPLAASDARVAAYLRVARGQTALVVANLSGVPLSGATVTGTAGALAPGRYTLHDLLGARSGAALRTDNRGGVAAYAPVPTLAPHETLVFALERT